MGYPVLMVAIVLEVIGTSFLMLSQQFTRLVPTAIMALAYLASFYFLSQALRYMPLGIAYAIWSGLGIVLTLAIGIVVFRQMPDWPAVAGIALIVLGVVVINGFSKVAGH
ncbi:DMT family transporter [Paracoccus alkenifer]|uniref:Small multidrug resistance pump n=1 Tax=Paracoccus alkenifer TaxID=65735 RepID=A0A1H6MDT6_9RHOB|nr:multidrug efflux SMR transporter [Paracoccus alkenifer]SEH95733.1 small multidrug resistance pump [Paracoccus alkenifer]HHY03231.1 multidrug efflux SMR transporter [Paracoccus sp. (in: a-proteobacteria)]